MIDWIMVRGARENNLKDLDLDLPKRKLIVLTGPSGSGKSTLAFDTIFAEGQRRYIESLSAYAKQFVEQLKRPDVESITGLCPSLAIQQKKISQNPRSTVATISEVYDYLRLLYSRVGEVIDPNTGEKLSAQSVGQMTDAVLRLGIGARISVLAIVAERKKGAFAKEIEKFVRLGFVRARIDGLDYELQIGQKLDKNKPHDFEIYIDRLVVKPEANLRLQDAIEKALEFGEGRFKIVVHSENDRILAFSRNLTSSDGSFSIPEMTPRLFSFNSPMGACPECKGMGYLGFEEWEASQDFDERVDDGEELAAEENLPCPLCKGSRLRLESRSVFINNLSIDQIHAMSIREALSAIQSFEFRGNQKLVSAKIIEELGNRLRFLEQVGLDYLNLNRMTKTLSGGEEQRVRLATQMGIHLRGVLYVLDEPSIGLHQLDNDRLIAAMKSLRDMGNTVLVVEHDIDTMRAADEIIDLGPGAGIHGGEIIEQATPREMKRGLTAEFLSGKRKIAVPEARRPLSKRWIKIKSAKVHNLKGIDVNIPLGVFVAVAGVSGSGKSSLILEVLAKSLREEKSVNCEELKGAENIDKLIEVSQSPIGRSPRSNPATYIDLFSGIRDLYSKVPLARQRGYGLGRFSFNVKGGRCEACQGAGESKIQMHFLPNVKVTCETCRGRRYNPATLECLYKGKTIHEVLEMSFEEALEFFEAVPYLRSKIQVVYDVGLGYLKLGQAATTLSGGEAQRIKLAKQLAKRQTGKTLYIMDEPTSGLHHVDVEQLLKVCQRLVDQGNSLIVIEHHLDVIKSADYVIDMGPLGGDRGGEIVGFGTPEELVKLSASHTGRFLKSFLSHGRAARARAS
ncbi:MAG: excinuclease ABC subunit A [Deltaproteobacteria bacterium CG11_big_fil_rev_8_21_14_0_20_45_16]|nr:MAG: excinuclease ABC subunit A [Deltaproteobacteria bacterium CG11_big_fil_rev_8_21_14_0_20_45_16]